MNFAELGIKVDTGEAVSAADDLDRLGDAAESAEAAVDGLANASKGLATAEAGASQSAERSATARERQAAASRRVFESAAGEIAILNQMDKAVINAAQSRESLGLANEIFVKAQERGLISAEEEIRILADLDKAERTVEAARLKSALAMERERTQLDALATTGDTSAKKILTLERAIGRMNQAIAKGHPDADKYAESIKRMQADLEGLRNPGDQAGGVIDSLGLKSKSARQNVAQLGNALASGNWRVAANNLVEIGNGANIASGRFMAMLGPAGLIAGAIGSIAAAYIIGRREQQAYHSTIVTTGNAAGVTSDQLANMANQISDSVGTTQAASKALVQLAADGKTSTIMFDQIAVAAIAFEKATGKAVEDTIREFKRLGEDPVRASKELNDQYGYLTGSVYAQIQALQDQGSEQQAVMLAEQTYADALRDRSESIEQNLGWIESGWNKVREAAGWAWDAMLDIGRDSTLEERLSNAYKLANDYASSRSKIGQGHLQRVLKDIEDLQAQIAERDSTLLANRQDEQRNRESVAAQDKLNRDLERIVDNRKKLAERLAVIDKLAAQSVEGGGKAYTEAELERLRADARERFKDREPQGTRASAARDNAGLARIEAISRQNALLEAQRDAVHNLSAGEKELISFNLEVAAIKERKILTTQQKQLLAHEDEIKAQLRQKVELERMVKLDEDRLKLAQFKASLESQQAQDQQGLDDSLKSLGLGDKEQRRLQEELRITEDYTRQMRRLRDQSNQGQISDDLYRQETAALEDALRTRLQMQRDHYDEVDKAQGDWTLGARAAYANYLDSARDVAGQSQQLFTNAFSSMEDSVVKFAMTGKASFADFTKSVLADMARIAARQTATNLVGSVVSFGASYFGGGASAGSTQTGYTGTDFSSWVSGQRATGGPVSPNSLYEVNERGPELLTQDGRTFLMMGAQGGSVTPLGTGPMSLAAASAGAGAPSQIYVEVNVASDGTTSVSTNQPGLQQFGDELGKFVDQRYRKLLSRDLAIDGAIGRKMAGR